jgi:hypothetical protein
MTFFKGSPIKKNKEDGTFHASMTLPILYLASN